MRLLHWFWQRGVLLQLVIASGKVEGAICTPEAGENLRRAEGVQRGERRRPEPARPADQFDLAGADEEQLGHQSLVDPHQAQEHPRDDLDEPEAQRQLRADPLLDPEPQAIEAPAGRPDHERPEDQPIEHSTQPPIADRVVVDGAEMLGKREARISAGLGQRGSGLRPSAGRSVSEPSTYARLAFSLLFALSQFLCFSCISPHPVRSTV